VTHAPASEIHFLGRVVDANSSFLQFLVNKAVLHGSSASVKNEEFVLHSNHSHSARVEADLAVLPIYIYMVGCVQST
jgi:hypothetical protein